MPIRTHIPQFSRVPSDPRPIEDIIRRVFKFAARPGTALRLWFAFLKKINATRWQAQCNRLLSYNPTSFAHGIHSQDGAENFVQKEDDRWNGREESGRFSTWTFDQVEPAFGYWLFPLTMLTYEAESE